MLLMCAAARARTMGDAMKDADQQAEEQAALDRDFEIIASCYLESEQD
jgi:hypothetical protein